MTVDLDNGEQVFSARNNNRTPQSIWTDITALPSKKMKLSPKSNGSICKICGDRAIGYNYDVLSCASCNAFFDRYARQPREYLKCLSNTGSCPIIYGIDRQCHRCRLDRCLSIGMRRDFILKREEEKRKETTEDLDNNLIEDWLFIEKLQSSFITTMKDENAYKFWIDPTDRESTIMSCLQSSDETIRRFVNFFRQIDDFQSLNDDDRFILIKCNLLLVFPIYKSFNYQSEHHYLSTENNEETRKFDQFCRLFDEMRDMRQIMIQLLTALTQLTKQDSIVMSLVLIILVFSRGLVISEDEPMLKDSQTMYRCQSEYTRLLWNYLIEQSNEQQACTYFLRLTSILFQLQSTGRIFRTFIYNHCFARNTIEQITPLMQSVLRISN